MIDAAKADATALKLQQETFQPRRFIEDLAELLAARAETKGLATEVTVAETLPQSACRRHRAAAGGA